MTLISMEYPEKNCARVGKYSRDGGDRRGAVDEKVAGFVADLVRDAREDLDRAEEMSRINIKKERTIMETTDVYSAALSTMTKMTD